MPFPEDRRYLNGNMGHRGSAWSRAPDPVPGAGVLPYLVDIIEFFLSSAAGFSSPGQRSLIAQGLLETLVGLGHPGQLSQLPANMPLEPGIVVDASDPVLVLSDQFLQTQRERGLLVRAIRPFRARQTHSSAAALS